MIDTIGSLIHEYFGLLDSDFIDDQFRDMARSLEDSLTDGYEVRYVLIDDETGQLESRTFFLSEEEAKEEAKEPMHGKNCSVAVVISESYLHSVPKRAPST